MTVINCRKRPLVVQAIQYLGATTKEIRRFARIAPKVFTYHQTVVTAEHEHGYRQKNAAGETVLYLYTLEGIHKVSIGDWIIRGVKGEFYPCKPDVFDTSYDIVIVPEQ